VRSLYEFLPRVIAEECVGSESWAGIVGGTKLEESCIARITFVVGGVWDLIWDDTVMPML
jgi:hypothetical protein